MTIGEIAFHAHERAGPLPGPIPASGPIAPWPRGVRAGLRKSDSSSRDACPARAAARPSAGVPKAFKWIYSMPASSSAALSGEAISRSRAAASGKPRHIDHVLDTCGL